MSKQCRISKAGAAFLVVAVSLLNLAVPSARVMAADHAESLQATDDQGADLGDSFLFLNPTDNTRVILTMTMKGFIVPGEMLNFGFFPHEVLYRFEIENTGDPVADRFIDVVFSQQTSRTAPQTATIYPNGIANKAGRFSAPTTVPTLNTTPPPFAITTDTTSGIRFFAGLTDDPFYFDIPAFSRFVSSVGAGAPDPSQFNRGRDAFAGYNTHVIALEMPVASLQGSAGNMLGLNTVTFRSRRGNYVQVDRAATPAVNTALIPFPRKNEFNSSTPVDDAAGRFAGSIVATLTSLGTSPANINILASVAVANGDILRLNTATPNLTAGFGERLSTPGYTGFPNGRRPGDDTIDVLLFFISNGALTMGDNVNSNEVPFINSFPFHAPPNQPFPAGTIDDRTRS